MSELTNLQKKIKNLYEALDRIAEKHNNILRKEHRLEAQLDKAEALEVKLEMRE